MDVEMYYSRVSELRVSNQVNLRASWGCYNMAYGG